MATETVKRAGLVGTLAVLVPLGILVWNEYEDWVKWKHEMAIIEKERALEVAGPMVPGRTLEGRVETLESYHVESDSL